MIEYYISSTKCSVQSRATKKHGTVYDVYFRVINKTDLTEKQDKLSGYATKTLAKKAHLDFIDQYCEILPRHLKSKKKDPTKRDLTVGELIREYLSTLPNQNKDSSIYEKINIYNRFVLPFYEKTKITDITKEELYKWQDRMWSTKNPRTNEYYSYNYLAKVRTQFAAFLSWCEKRYSYNNHFPEIEKPKRRAPKREMPFWTREEFAQFIEVVDDPMWHAFFTILFFTGRRKGEVFALTKQDITQSKDSTTILFNKSLTRKTLDHTPYKITSTKADKSQNLIVSEVVHRELQSYPGEEPFFFGGQKPLAEMTVDRRFRSYAEKAGVKPMNIHGLRHSFVSYAISQGANMKVIADLIGDTVEQVTKTYGHMYISDKVALVQSLI